MHGMPFHLQQWRPRPFLVATRGKSIAESRVGGSLEPGPTLVNMVTTGPNPVVTISTRVGLVRGGSSKEQI